MTWDHVHREESPAPITCESTDCEEEATVTTHAGLLCEECAEELAFLEGQR